MSTWRIVIDFEWPDKLPERDGYNRQANVQDLVFDLLEPLNRDNVQWYDARLELARDPDGSY